MRAVLQPWRFSIVVSAALALTLMGPSPVARAVGKTEFTGATVTGNRLVAKTGFKLRQVSPGIIETYKEEVQTGGTARRLTKPVAVDHVNVRCFCGTEVCAIFITEGAATCAGNGTCKTCSIKILDNQ